MTVTSKAYVVWKAYELASAYNRWRIEEMDSIKKDEKAGLKAKLHFLTLMTEFSDIVYKHVDKNERSEHVELAK